MSGTRPPPRAEVECANCGRRFIGGYCPDCGQAVEAPRRPVGAILRDFLGTALSFDTRFWRTVKPLMFRPGLLTREYFAGRRARYVPPLRLYVFSAVVFFAVMAATNGGPMRVVERSELERETTVGWMVDPGAVERELVIADEARETGSSGFERWLGERLERIQRRPDAFNAAMIDAFSYGHFLTLPLFALILWIFWRRRYYVEHLVLGMHFHAFALLVGAVMVAAFAATDLDPDGPAAGIAMSAWLLALGGYLYATARRVYGGRWWAVVLRVVGSGWLYLFVVSMVTTGVALIAMITF